MVRRSYLKNIPLFAGFSERDLKQLMRIGRVVDFGCGERVFCGGSCGDNLYVVLAGRIKIYTEDGSKKKTLAYLEKGEFFGEMALVDVKPRSASSLAMEPSELFVIKKKCFQKFIADYPGMLLQVVKTLSRRLRQADKEIESFAFGDVLGRIASTLLQLSAKYGRVTKDGCTIQMPLNQRDIAEIVGTGREMVSRTLNRFRRLKLIDYNERYVMVIDVQKLKLFSSTGEKA